MFPNMKVITFVLFQILMILKNTNKHIIIMLNEVFSSRKHKNSRNIIKPLSPNVMALGDSEV